jgi:prepilin-type N-terminal cleavage/methylation domain-containing protein
MRHIIRGFTLLELIVVIAIIGVLSVIILPSFKNALDKANATKVSQNIINTIKRYDVFAKWEFEEGSGLTAKDTAVNPVDTTVQNNATIPVSGVTYSDNTYASSSQKSLLFNGSNYITTVNNTYPKLDNSSFSFSLWFRRTGFGAGDIFLLEKGTIGLRQDLVVGFRDDQLLISFYGPDYAAPVYITDQLWHNLMFSYDVTSNLLVVYLDSRRIGQYNTGGPLTGTDNYPLKIGTYNGGRFIGNIDDVYYFKDVIVR